MTEQQIIDILFFIIRNVLGNVIYFVFFAAILTPKYNKFATVALQSVAAIAAFEILSRFGADTTFPFFVLFIIGNCLLFYKEKKLCCLLAAGLFFVVMIVTDIFASSAIFYIFGYHPSKVSPLDWKSVITEAFAQPICALIFAVYTFLWNRLFRKKNVKSMGMFMLFPFGQVFFIAAFAKGTYENENNNFYVYSEPLFVISVLISVVADVLMYFALRDNSNMNHMRNRLSEIEKEMEQQLNYYDAISDKFSEIRQYRHDILNLVSTSEVMLNNKLSETESKEYIKSLKEKAEDLEVPIYCNNPIVNAVLWQKQQAAEKSGIEFSMDIDQSENFPIDRIDICSLMANLVDNALRGCADSENPFVEINVSRKINMLFISVRNSCKNLKEDVNSKRLPSTKDGDHGYGMEIINMLAEKYNGTFTFSVLNGTADASVMLDAAEA